MHRGDVCQTAVFMVKYIWRQSLRVYSVSVYEKFAALRYGACHRRGQKEERSLHNWICTKTAKCVCGAFFLIIYSVLQYTRGWRKCSDWPRWLGERLVGDECYIMNTRTRDLSCDTVIILNLFKYFIFCIYCEPPSIYFSFSTSGCCSSPASFVISS